MKTVQLPDIGEVQLIKHANAQSLRISLSGDGKIKVTLPKWVPYQAGVAFAQSKRAWIIENKQPLSIIKNGSAVGKFHHLYFKAGNYSTISSRQKGSELWVSFPESMRWDHLEVQAAANKAATRALRGQAESLLPKRLHDLAQKHGFTFQSVSVRQLKARWGSCNSKQEITLNLFLMQLPWELIDYVLIHELVHTKALHHGADFWRLFEAVLPGAKQRRKELKAYKPQFEGA